MKAMMDFYDWLNDERKAPLWVFVTAMVVLAYLVVLWLFLCLYLLAVASPWLVVATLAPVVVAVFLVVREYRRAKE